MRCEKFTAPASESAVTGFFNTAMEHTIFSMLAMIRRAATGSEFFLTLFLLCSSLAAGQTAHVDSAGVSPVAQLFDKIQLDVDGDGDLDLVGKTSRSRSEWELWINQGHDKWTNGGSIVTSIRDPQLLVADVNHDGCADLVITDRAFLASPEIWNGRKNGSLEKSSFDTPSISTPPQSETSNAPEDQSPALLWPQQFRDGAKMAILNLCATASSSLARHILRGQQPVFISFSYSIRPGPRSPPSF
ncbi:MAG TPA: FG-GAP-like repeat-containing protein [Acidobacteriota bacterium]